jgi:hypothetical protein
VSAVLPFREQKAKIDMSTKETLKVKLENYFKKGK